MIKLDDDLLANIVRTARFFLERAQRPAGTAPLALQIEECTRKAASQLLEHSSPEELNAYVQEAVREVSDGLRVQIADDKILVEGAHFDWYFGERLHERPLWDRYRRFLAYEERLGSTTLAGIDRSSDKVVAQLGDPTSPNPFDRRGLVVGQVQSGKTTSYSAVLNKAIDAGYRTIIILTGIHESLRVQTQKRIEEGVRGLSTGDGRVGGIGRDTPLRLAKIKAVASPPNLFTTRARGGDFAGEAHHFAIAVSGTQIFVVKKNTRILAHIRSFFQSTRFHRLKNPATGTEEIHDRPLLIIDDEADNASVDNRRPDPTDRDHDPSAINREIRKLLLQFRQRAYVGYTATPYANILIHKDNEATDVGADLFPKDFIVMLAAPSNYVGPGLFFGGAPSDSAAEPVPPLVRHIDDCGTTSSTTDWMRLGHDKSHTPRFSGEDRLPPSLETAVLTFLLAGAVRQLRGRHTAHNSMLVHVSKFKAVQRLVRVQIEAFLYELKGELDHLSPARPLVDQLDLLYTGDFLSTTSRMAEQDRGEMPPLDEVRNQLRNLLDSVQLRVVNSEAETELDYDNYPNGLSVICVGGDKLSRGLTLEGLSVSYFLRATRMYDTLMQMGRWFGYRPGYKDLCRLYLTRDLERWFQHITRADEELRAEFQNLQDENARPRDFGLRVRSHPTLLVTAPAKMSSSAQFDLDFGGRVMQTIHFHRDRAHIEANAEFVSRFLVSLAANRVPGSQLVRRDAKTGSQKGAQPLPGVLYRDVSIADILRFIEAFQFHPEARRVAGTELREFLRHARKAGVIRDWSVLLASAGDGSVGDASVEVAPGVSVVPVHRATKPPAAAEWSSSVAEDTLTLGVLSSPTDLIADFTEEEAARLGALPVRATSTDLGEAERVARNRACCARDESRGLMVLYVIRPTTRAPADEAGASAKIAVGFDPDCKSLPIGVAFALPKTASVPTVPYVVNSVFIDKLEESYEATAGREDEG